MVVKRKSPAKKKSSVKRRPVARRKSSVKRTTRLPKNDHEAVMQTVNNGQAAMIIPDHIAVATPSAPVYSAPPPAPMMKNYETPRSNLANRFSSAFSGLRKQNIGVRNKTDCDSGYTWNASRGVCLKDGGYTPAVTPKECFPGNKWDSSLNKCVSICEKGSAWDIKSGLCKPLTTAINEVAKEIKAAPGASPAANSIVSTPNATIQKAVESLPAAQQTQIVQKVDQAATLVENGQPKQAEKILGQVSGVLNNTVSSHSVSQLVKVLNNEAKETKAAPGASPAANAIVSTPNTVLEQKIKDLSPAKQEKVAELVQKIESTPNGKQSEVKLKTLAEIINQRIADKNAKATVLGNIKNVFSEVLNPWDNTEDYKSKTPGSYVDPKYRYDSKKLGNYVNLSKNQAFLENYHSKF